MDKKRKNEKEVKLKKKNEKEDRTIKKGKELDANGNTASQHKLGENGITVSKKAIQM